MEAVKKREEAEEFAREEQRRREVEAEMSKRRAEIAERKRVDDSTKIAQAQEAERKRIEEEQRSRRHEIDSLKLIAQKTQDSLLKIIRARDSVSATALALRSKIASIEKTTAQKQDSIARENLLAFARMYDNTPPSNVARILENLEPRDAAFILKQMKKKNSGKVLEAMNPERAATLLSLSGISTE